MLVVDFCLIFGFVVGFWMWLGVLAEGVEPKQTMDEKMANLPDLREAYPPQPTHPLERMQ